MVSKSPGHGARSAEDEVNNMEGRERGRREGEREGEGGEREREKAWESELFSSWAPGL